MYDPIGENPSLLQTVFGDEDFAKGRHEEAKRCQKNQMCYREPNSDQSGAGRVRKEYNARFKTAFAKHVRHKLGKVYGEARTLARKSCHHLAKRETNTYQEQI